MPYLKEEEVVTFIQQLKNGRVYSNGRVFSLTIYAVDDKFIIQSYDSRERENTESIEKYDEAEFAKKVKEYFFTVGDIEDVLEMIK